MADNKPEPVGSKMPAELRDIVQKMIDDDADDATISTVVDRYMDDHDAVIDQTINELKGLVKGTVAGAASSIKGVLWDLPTGVVGDLYSVAKGQTPENAKALIEGIASMKDLPEQFKNATHEERGEIMGQFLGGFAAAKYAPGTPRTVAKGVGTAMEFTGKKAGWPLRMVGAHALGEGNVVGAAMIAAPEALEATGQALKNWGEGGVKKFPAGTVRLVNPVTDKVVAKNPGVLKTKSGPSARVPSSTPKDQANFRSAVASNLKKGIDELPDNMKKGVAEVDKAIGESKKESKGIRIAARKTEDAAFKAETRADIDKLKIDKAQEKINLKEIENEARLEDIRAGRKAAGVVPKKPSFSTSVSAAGPEGRESMRTSYGLPEEEAMAGLTPFEQEMLKRASSVRSAPSSVVDKLAPKTEPLPREVRQMAEPIESAPATSVVQSTRSSNARNETIPALSENDIDSMVEILRGNPGITKEEALGELVKQRAQRHTQYRDTAGLSRLEQSALDRDLE